MQASPLFPHRLDIQGLRGLAVLLVLFGHAFPRIVPGGFVGVDVFFVISGYVIGRLVIGESDAGRFNLLSFYRRRMRRLLPAFLMVIAVSLACGVWLLDPWQFSALGRAAGASVFMAANVHASHSVAYFSAAALTKPLLHLWTIGVEGQFYLLFPLGIIIARRLAGRYLLSLVVIALLLSLAVSEYWLFKHNAQAAYYLLPSRLFELLIGTAVALAPDLQGVNAKARSWAALAGVGLVILAASLFNSLTSFPGLAALLPCLGTALAIWAGDRNAGLLTAPPLVFIGTISYSLYLWHWPLLAFGQLALGPGFDGLDALLLLIASILFGAVSYRWLERPFLGSWQGAHETNNWRGLAAAGVAAAVIFFAGRAIVGAEGFPSRYSPQALALAQGRDDFNLRRDKCHNGRGQPLAYAENCRFGDTASYPDLAVWGDSRGAEIALALGERAKGETRSVMQITASGCPPARGYREADHPNCEAWIAATLEALVADRRVKTVVLAAAGAFYDDEAALTAGYEKTVHALVAAGKSVVLISENPVYRFDPPAFLALMENFGGDPIEAQAPAARFVSGQSGRWRQFLATLAGATGAQLIDPYDTLCPEGQCRLYDREAGVLYFDSFHLSVAGARLVVAPLTSPSTALSSRTESSAIWNR